ncbi:MAG: hypothetical protein ACOX8U_06125 [Bradymonadia bacterium]
MLRLKSYIVVLSACGFLGGFALACGDDSAKSCNVAEFVEVCDAGRVVTCQANDKGKGKVVFATQVCDGELIVSCDGDKLHRGVICDAGKLKACADGVPAFIENNLLCDGDKIVSCNANNTIVTHDRVCSAGLIRSCSGGKLLSHTQNCKGAQVEQCDDNGEIQAYDCGNGMSCESYEKGGELFYSCFESGGEGCGEVTNVGTCDGEVLKFCSKKTQGKLLTLNCGATSRKCMKIEDVYGFDCAVQCGSNNQYTDFGSCENDSLNYCTQSGDEMSISCKSNTCKFNGTYYNCIPK